VKLNGRENLYHVGVEIVIFVVMKTFIFWNIMSRNLLKVNQCFGGKCYLQLLSWRISQASYWQEELAVTGFLLGLFFNPENRGNTFLQNISWLSTKCTCYILKDRTFRSLLCLLYLLNMRRKISLLSLSFEILQTFENWLFNSATLLAYLYPFTMT
jgi:hypothetical protein